MWQLAILLWSSLDIWLRILVGAALSIASALSYNRYNYRRILDDPRVTRGLNAEQRLRLELGMIDTSPHIDATDPLHPVSVVDGGEMAAVVRKAREDSRRREYAHIEGLNPGELSRLRIRMDHVLRERWARIEEKFTALGEDPAGETWDGLVNGELGLMALLTDLALELHSAKHQGTYPPVVLQLEGPLGPLADVIRHAQLAVDPATSESDAQQLRAGVLEFVVDTFPGICENIHETEVHYALDEEFDLAREVELTSQDLPTE